jgi:hypothetical protein
MENIKLFLKMKKMSKNARKSLSGIVNMSKKSQRLSFENWKIAKHKNMLEHYLQTKLSSTSANRPEPADEEGAGAGGRGG